jgi:nucleotide-binding universal stress UspA family protein
MSATSIVVGLDGSPASATALQWAVRRAEGSDLGLRVVHVYENRGGQHLRSLALRKVRESHARARATEWMNAALGPGPHTARVRLEVAEGSAIRVLSSVSKQADLLVLGAPRSGGVHRLLSGSIARRCSGRASCPVVLVPAQELSETGEPEGQGEPSEPSEQSEQSRAGGGSAASTGPRRT